MPRCKHLKLIGETYGGGSLYECEVDKIRVGSPRASICIGCKNYTPIKEQRETYNTLSKTTDREKQQVDQDLKAKNKRTEEVYMQEEFYDFRAGDIVKVDGLVGIFKVISIQKLKNYRLFELLSLKDNQLRKIVSPPYRLRIVLSPIELLKKEKFDPSYKFNLLVEANHLSLSYSYEPLLSLSTTKLHILPHQVEAVYRMLDHFEPRFLLADDAGLGKTIMAGMLIQELKLRKRVNRVIIIVPAALQYQWRRELREHFKQQFVIFNSNYINYHNQNYPRTNPWENVNYVITSMDYIKRETVLMDLRHVTWDLAIFDEAHKLAAHKFGSSEMRTKRYALGETIRDQTKSLLLLTATPHSGESYAFFKLVSLLDPYIFVSESDLNRDKLKRIMIRRLKEDVFTLEGKSLFPERESKTITVYFSEEEKELYEQVTNYAQYYFNLAKASRNRGVSFAMTILQKRMASSICAIKQSLRNRLGRLETLLQEGVQQVSSQERLNYLIRLEEEGLDFDDLDEEEQEKLLKEYEVLTLASNPEELRREITHLEELIKLADSVTRDSKAEHLMTFIDTILKEDPQEKILIFTEYRDTLSDLINRFKKQGFKLAVIHGGMRMPDRTRQEEVFKSKDVQIMVATDAAGEGLNLQFAHIMVNYELPWNPNKLVQRIGRLHRYLQNKKVFVYNLLVQDTIEGRIFQKLMDKIEIIKQEIGDRVFDVLGILMSEIKINDLVMETIGKSSEWVATVEKAEEKIDEAKRMVIEKLDKISLIRDKLDLSSIKELIEQFRELLISDGEIERFVVTFFSHHDGKLKALDTQGIFSIKLPKQFKSDKEIMESLYIMGSERKNEKWISFKRPLSLTFSKDKSGLEIRYVALGHPLINKIIRTCINSEFGGKATIKRDPKGRTGLLLAFKNKILTSRGETRNEKLSLFFYDKDAKNVEEIDPTGIWEFEDVTYPMRIKLPPLNFINEGYEKAEEKDIELLNDLLNGVKEKVKREVDVKRTDIQRSYNFKINELTESHETIRNEYRQLNLLSNEEERMRRSRTRASRIGRVEAEIKRLSESTTEKVSELDREEELIYEAPELIATALVIPKRTSRGTAERKRENIKKIEEAGMRFAMDYEEKQGREPQDVSKQFKGYDILSEDKTKKRYIEVKSFAETGSLEITSHEWLVADKLKEDYWLYIIEHALIPKDRKLYTIQNPSQTLSDVANWKSFLEYKIVIDLWKDHAQST